MIIGIDGNEANVEKRVGISEYAFELLTQFSNFQFSIFNFQFRIYLKDKPRSDIPKEREGWEYRIIGPRKLWTQIGLPLDLYLHKPRPDVFFTPTHYGPRFSPIPTAISVMDLSYMHFPEMFKKSDLYQLSNWTAYSVRNAKRVFTISNASKSDIIKYYQVNPEKVVVTYPGIKVKSQMSKVKTDSGQVEDAPRGARMTNSKLLEKYGIRSKYVLFVGTLQPRKNITRLIEAFSHVLQSDSIASLQNDLKLIIVGKKGWLYEEILAAPKKYGVEKQVKFLEFVPDEDLSILYQNAVCFVLPSLYEGFGLPVLEAMQQGCPVITSNVSSLPEAGGDAALYVDPMDTDDIAKKMQMVIENKKLQAELREKGYKQVKKFSWEKTAQETLAVLEEVINKQ